MKTIAEKLNDRLIAAQAELTAAIDFSVQLGPDDRDRLEMLAKALFATIAATDFDERPPQGLAVPLEKVWSASHVVNSMIARFKRQFDDAKQPPKSPK